MNFPSVVSLFVRGLTVYFYFVNARDAMVRILERGPLLISPIFHRNKSRAPAEGLRKETDGTGCPNVTWKTKPWQLKKFRT